MLIILIRIWNLYEFGNNNNNDHTHNIRNGDNYGGDDDIHKQQPHGEYTNIINTYIRFIRNENDFIPIPKNHETSNRYCPPPDFSVSSLKL